MTKSATKTTERRAPLHQGRRARLTKDIEGQILGAVRNGVPLTTIADLVNVLPETIREWLAKGDAALAKKPADRTINEKAYASLAEKYRPALASAKVRPQINIHTIATLPVRDEDGTLVSPEQQRVILRAAETDLRYLDPEHYTPKTRAELTGADGGALELRQDADAVFDRMQVVLSREDDGEA